MDNIAYIGIGSNQGDALTSCTVAIEHICASGHNRLLSQSSFYHTEPWGYRDQDDFINLVIKIKTSLSPFDLLSFLQGVEKKLAKKQDIPWGPRTIDLDILFYNNAIVESSQLTIPHSFVSQRGFVLYPLEEISPHLIHPVYNQTISQLLDSLDDDKRVIKILKEST
jgi:2-amino-4-hydroxy-6-hydroxymethyldihydropteridine diphosphokinase